MHREPARMDPSPTFFEEALNRYERPLIRYARSFTRDLESARDIVQDVFLRLSQNLGGVDPHRLAPWLFTVCKNLAVDHQRKHHRLIPMEAELLELEASPEPGPSEAAENRETAAALRALLDELPERQREAMRLKFIAGLSYQQISDAMQTSIGNVGYLIHHGVQSMREKWTAQETVGA